MTDTPLGTFVFEGAKITIKALKCISDDLPPPTSSIVNIAQGIIVKIEAVHNNKEHSNRLRDRILQLLAVILMAVKESTSGRKDEAALSHNLTRFQGTLEAIFDQVNKIRTVATSTSLFHKISAYTKTSSYASILQTCSEDLDWAAEAFDVTAHLENAAKLCQIYEKLSDVAQDSRTVRSTQTLESLPRAKYAGSGCQRLDRPSKCLEGTRKDLLDMIVKWAVTTDPTIARFFWLKGIAGCGKSTVARTIAEIAQDRGILGGQFFFSRKGEAELRNPALVFPTIAYQLARFDPEFSHHITAALEADRDAPFAALQQQLERLIIKPLSKVKRDSKRVVVIVFDAFDECEAVGAKEILQLLVAAMPQLPFYLKIFVTGRPEHHIHSVLTPSPELRIAALHDIEESVVTSDIELYLRDRLRSLPAEKKLKLPRDWIKDHEIKLLAYKAGRLFIHAATSIRFLLNCLDLKRQLEILLRIVSSVVDGSDFTNPFASLDTLYMEILRGTVNNTNTAELSAAHQIIVGSIVRLRDPLPVLALRNLIGPRSPDPSLILDHLHSVILPPTPPDDCPRIYHPSFPDFLLDPARCSDPSFHIDAKKHEARLALRCLHLVNTKLRKGMLGDLDPAELNSLKDLDDKIRAVYPPELQYACRYWASHVAGASEENPEIVKAVRMFAAKTMLPWVESMSWLGDVHLCLTSLESINTWAVKVISDPHTMSLLNDGYRLLLAHFSTVKLSAQHIARSILPFLPRNICLTRQFQDYADAGVTVHQGVESEWPACLMAWEAHSECVNSVAFSSDGLRVASASSDNTMSVWDATTGVYVIALAGHTRSVTSVTYSPDGSRLASGSEDESGRVWDTTTGICLTTLDGHSGQITSVAFSPDSRRIASGSTDTTVRLWDATTGECVNILEGHTGSITSVAYSPKGSQLASASADETVCLWDDTAGEATGSFFTTLTGHSSTVSSVVYSPDGLRLASASYDDTVQLWDTSTGECIATLRGHSDAVTSVAFSPDGSRLASGSEDMTVRVWDTAAGNCLSTLEGHSSHVTFVAFSPYGSRLASGSNDKTIRVWDTTASRSLAPRRGHSQAVTAMAFSADGTRLASGSADATVQLWDTATGDHLAALPGHSGRVTSLAFYSGLQLASGSDDKTIRMWDTSERVCLAIRKGHTDCVMSVASTPDGSRLASASKDRIIRIWDTATRNCLTTLRGHSKSVNSVVFASDGVRLISGSDDGTVRVWDTSTGACLGSEDHSTRITCVDLNGLQITACGSGGEMYVQDLPTATIPPEREQGTHIACRYELKDGRLHQIEAAGSTSLVCLIPVFYHVEVSTSFILNEGGARVAFGCHNGEVVILEVAK